MPNAKDATLDNLGPNKSILLGYPGSGKTTQLLTLPGNTFAYLFDPSALASLRGYDIEYGEFVPDVVNLAAQSLTKGVGDPLTSLNLINAHEVYDEWENDFEKKVKERFFDPFDNIGFDSFTTFGDIVMDRILFLNKRPGRVPQQDDYGAQMGTIKNVVRTLVSLKKQILCTGHVDFVKDDVTGRVMNQPILTGKLRTRLPLLFSDIYYCECQSDAKQHKYVVQTRPDRFNPTVRCSLKGLEMYEDVTIANWNNPKEYGIGRLLRDARSRERAANSRGAKVSPLRPTDV